MTIIHEVLFPRYSEDIMSEKRTLFHVPIDKQPWKVGDGLRLRVTSNFSSRCKIGVLTCVRQVRLLAELEADLGKLAAKSRAEYLARWDALHPDLPSAGDPIVRRIEFRYGMWKTDPTDPTDPPEWSLAG